ncbi:MAG: hypothetical protein WCF12_16380, partial [Propionicimonas sp.]
PKPWPPSGSRRELFNELLRRDFIPAPTVMVRTDLMKAAGGYDPDLTFEDYDMWLRLARIHPFTVVNEPLVYNRTTPGSLGEALRNDIAKDYFPSLIRTLSKHYGMDQQTDDQLTDYLIHPAVRSYLAGMPAREVKGILLRYARRHRTPSAFALAGMAQAGFPGTFLQLFERLKRVIRR